MSRMATNPANLWLFAVCILIVKLCRSRKVPPFRERNKAKKGCKKPKMRSQKQKTGSQKSDEARYGNEGLGATNNKMFRLTPLPVGRSCSHTLRSYSFMNTQKI